MALPELPAESAPPVPAYRPASGWLLALAVALIILTIAAGSVVGGEAGHVALAAIETLPLVALAFLTYLGTRRLWARFLAVAWLLLLLLGCLVLSLGLSVQTLGGAGATFPQLGPGNGPVLARIALGLMLGGALGCLAFIGPIRRALARVIPIDPGSFVHAVACVAVIALTLMSAVPLLALGQPPLLAAIESVQQSRDRGGLLRDDLYRLAWLVPGAIVAVGWGVTRGLGDALRRVGLVRPTRRQVMMALGLAVVFTVFFTLLDLGIARVWDALGWPRTDQEAFRRLMAYTLSPIGALVIGVSAGLGEELSVRGVLQPRLGILLSNAMFTAMHAFQYNWDALLSVFIAGLMLGVIRRRSNTTTSAIVHGVYDFILILGAALGIPYLS